MLTNRFETVLADDEESREIHYKIRFQVFCEETGFEESKRFPDRKERDDFDTRATHFIVWDRLHRQWVGAMRLVDGLSAPLPCEAVCGKPLEGLETARGISREFSRLCILSKYRQTAPSSGFALVVPDGDPTGRPIPVFLRQENHEILLRLLRASFAWGKDNGIDYCYFIVNAALARVLERFGIPLTVAGTPVQHRGARIPHRYDVREAEAGMAAALPSFARLMRNSSAYVRYSAFVRGRANTEARTPTALPRMGTPAIRHSAFAVRRSASLR